MKRIGFVSPFRQETHTMQQQTQTLRLKVKKGACDWRAGGILSHRLHRSVKQCRRGSGGGRGVYWRVFTQFLTRGWCDVRSGKEFKVQRELDSRWLLFIPGRRKKNDTKRREASMKTNHRGRWRRRRPRRRRRYCAIIAARWWNSARGGRRSYLYSQKVSSFMPWDSTSGCRSSFSFTGAKKQAQ